MKFINKNFNIIVIILFFINIVLMLLLYNLGMDKINTTEGNLRGNHLDLNNKPLLNEMIDKINIMSEKINVLEQKLNNLKTTCDTKMNKVLISLCNINDNMGVKPNKYPNQNVGEKNEESAFSRGCYNTIGVN